MRITESNMTLASQWAHLRPDETNAPTRGARENPAPETAVVAATSRLDTDLDGWLDEDDVPYDQLERLARRAEDDAELGGLYLGAAAVTAPASAARATHAAPAEPLPEPAHEQPGGAAQIDLLA
jgi:hypothetical protein